MSYEYYVLYKPETKQELEIRYDERWGKWGYNWKNPGGEDRWAKFSDDMIPQIEPNLKKYGYKMPRIIITEEEYEAALKRAWELWDSEPNTIEEHELNRWVDVIVDYENKHYPIDEPDNND
jgi:hypothetical protein